MCSEITRRIKSPPEKWQTADLMVRRFLFCREFLMSKRKKKMNSGWNKSISEKDKAFPLIPGGWQDEKRMLVGLFKQGPLETREQFAQRVWKAWQEHQAKQPTKG